MSSFYFNYLVKTKSIAKKVLMFLYYNWLILQNQGGKKYWYGAGGWSKKLKHWLKLLAISTYKIDFAFDGSQIQTRGEVG